MRQGANRKTRKMRKEIRKGNIHLHIGFSKTQELKTSLCSLGFLTALLHLLGFVSHCSGLDYIETSLFLEKKAETTIFSHKNI